MIDAIMLMIINILNDSIARTLFCAAIFLGAVALLAWVGLR